MQKDMARSIAARSASFRTLALRSLHSGNILRAQLPAGKPEAEVENVCSCSSGESSLLAVAFLTLQVGSEGAPVDACPRERAEVPNVQIHSVSSAPHL